VITAERLRRCGSVAEVFGLLRDLGYDVAPVNIAAADWRRAGIDIPWNEGLTLQLAARTPQLDVYVVSGEEPPDSHAIAAFLRSLATYNALVKPVAICASTERLTIHDLSSRREPRRLDVDLRHPTTYALDRLNLLGSGSDPERIFDRALDRESLTRQFFERFRRAVREVSQAIRAARPEESHDAADGQALLLLSRLLFLYFVQQKGWLNGERRFLVDRIEAAVRERRGVYATLLVPLFFGCLNTAAHDRDRVARQLGKIPYLNGGLFEPSAFELRNANLNLPDDLLQRVVEEVFERFAFSIDESDAAGAHIDPEMLGKVFESLMNTDERLSTGSFYTPKAIVDVLAARAITGWLSESDVPTREMLERILRGEPVRRTGNAEALARRLDAITILDPACGSGAFLLSALRVVERLATALNPEPAADLRRRIVERSLYGVDLKPEAVRLCELRLWLAIVSQAGESIDNIQPLPNLDRNILQGNSLLSPTDFLGDNRGDIYREWVYALRAQSDLIERYRNAPQKERALMARLIRANDGRLASDLVAKAIDLDEQEQEQLCAPQRDLFGRLRELNLVRCRELHAHRREPAHAGTDRGRRDRLLLLRRSLRPGDGARRLRRRRRQPALGTQQPHRAAREADVRRAFSSFSRRWCTRQGGLSSARSLDRLRRSRAFACRAGRPDRAPRSGQAAQCRLCRAAPAPCIVVDQHRRARRLVVRRAAALRRRHVPARHHPVPPQRRASGILHFHHRGR
jgi:hypothetical protein